MAPRSAFRAGCAMTDVLDAQGLTAEEFMYQLFEFEYCHECGGDTDDHVAGIDPIGNWHAWCKEVES